MKSNKLLPIATLLLLGFGTTLLSCTQSKKTNGAQDENAEVAAVDADQFSKLAQALLRYNEIQSFSDGLAAVQIDETNLWGFIDHDGNEVIPCSYEFVSTPFRGGVAIVGDGESTFVIDKHGKKLFNLPSEYTSSEFHDGLLAFCRSHDVEDFSDLPSYNYMLSFGYQGFVDTEGNVVIPAEKYDVPLGEGPYWSDFSEGLCKVFKQDKILYINTQGEEVIQLEGLAGGGNFHDGLATVLNDNWAYGFINKDGKIVIPCQYSYAADFSEGLAAVSNDAGKIGFIDSKGKLVIPYSFDTITFYEGTEGEEPFSYEFHEGLAAVVRDGKCGYIDTTGKLVIPCRYTVEFDDECEWYTEAPVGNFSGGMACVWDKATNTWGYIDRQGNEVISCQFESANNFSEGVAVICRDGKYGLVDTAGHCTLDM